NPSPFVVNCTSYGSVPHPVTFKQLIPLYLKLVHRYPLPNTFRYSNHVWSGKNTVVKEIISLFEHYIPAVGFDFILTLKGKKPRLMSLYRYLDKVMMTSTYFMTRNWEYEIKNFRNLKNEVSPEEAKMLYTDIGDLNFEEYANDLPKGAPYFDWRLDKMPKTKRLKLAKKFYHFTVYMQVVSIIILFWIFYSLCSLMANMSLTN
ncbi:fatty acyl-CoA reductase 2, partial [Nephila pilipes]